MVNPSRVAFALFGREIYWYGVLIALGVLLAIIISVRNARFKGWKQDDVLDFCILAIPFGIVFARLYYVAFEWSRYRDNLWSIVRIWEGGVAIYGAVIGGLIAAVIFCRTKKLRLPDLLDIAAPGLVLAQAIGRWGNFFNQEAYGIEVVNKAHMWFPMAVRIDATNTIHYATFFYESMWCLLIFAFLMVMYNRFKHKGDVFFWYAMLYAFERMFVEGLRTDSLWLIPEAVRISQLLSFLVFVAIAVFFAARYFKEKKNGPAPQEEVPAEAQDAGEPAADAVCIPQAEEGEPAEESAEPEKEPVEPADERVEDEPETTDADQDGNKS